MLYFLSSSKNIMDMTEDISVDDHMNMPVLESESDLEMELELKEKDDSWISRLRKGRTTIIITVVFIMLMCILICLYMSGRIFS